MMISSENKPKRGPNAVDRGTLLVASRALPLGFISSGCGLTIAAELARKPAVLVRLIGRTWVVASSGIFVDNVEKNYQKL